MVVLGRAYRGLTGGFLLLRNFSVAISVSPRVCFILVLILILYVSKIMRYDLGIFHANRSTKCLRNQGRTKGEGWSTANYLKPPPPPPPSNFIASCSNAALLIWFFGDF